MPHVALQAGSGGGGWESHWIVEMDAQVGIAGQGREAHGGKARGGEARRPGRPQPRLLGLICTLSLSLSHPLNVQELEAKQREKAERLRFGRFFYR